MQGAEEVRADTDKDTEEVQTDLVCNILLNDVNDGSGLKTDGRVVPDKAQAPITNAMVSHIILLISLFFLLIYFRRRRRAL